MGNDGIAVDYTAVARADSRRAAAVARADSRRAENEAVLGEHRTCQVDWLICPFCDDVLR